MNFVERKFKIPVRMYEGKSLEEANRMDKPVAFRVATRRITHTDIMGWGQMRFRELEDIEEERGEFPCTIIHLMDDDVICAWPIKKFEDELVKFANKYEAWQEEEIKKGLEEVLFSPDKGDD